MPAPIRPVQPGDPISAARFNEVVDALNASARISGAYPICVSHDAAGVRIELASQLKAWLFEIEETPPEVPRTEDGVAYYDATRIRLDSGGEYAPQEPQHVRLYDPLTRQLPDRVLKQGDWALATFNSDTGRWEIARDPEPGAQLVRFRTTATLAIGDSAEAVIVRALDGDDEDGAAITVADSSAPGAWFGPAGSQGIACKLPGRAVYDILWMEHPWLFAVGTSAGVALAGEISVLVSSGWDGAGLPSGTDTFYDVAGNYADATPGQVFVARLDPATGQYKIIDGPPGAGASLIRFELYEDLDEGASALANGIDYVDPDWITATGDPFTVWDPMEFGPAKAGRRGWCTYKADSEKYEIVSLDQETAEIGWFYASEDHTLDDSDFSKLHFVRGQVCDDSLGSNPHGETLTFYLHSPSSATCPSVQQGAVLPYHTDSAGRRVADGAYLDDYRGACKLHIGPEATIPFGWRLCNGDNGTPNLRGLFILAAAGDEPLDDNFDAHGHGDQIGALGGRQEHTHSEADDDTPGRMQHKREGNFALKTDDTALALRSSPGQAIETSEENAILDITAESALDSAYVDIDVSGSTGYSRANVKVIDPLTYTTLHKDHIHQLLGGDGAKECSGATQIGVSGNTTYFTGWALDGLEACGSINPIDFEHIVIEPGDFDQPVADPTHRWGDETDFATPSGATGHNHQWAIAGSFPVSGAVQTDIHLDQSPHKHTVPLSSITSGMWIEDVTHYDGDAAKHNQHYHDLELDDHQLLPGSHIPPYYALAHIMRTH